MTLYVVAFFYFFHRVSGVFTQVFVIYIFRFFPLGFFEDCIHSTRCLSAQGGVLQYTYVIT
jgi:hypothetical protein